MNSHFGTVIREQRIKLNMLQKQVAQNLDIDTPLLSKIERGERKPHKEQIPVFANSLHLEEKYLFKLWFYDRIISIIQNDKLSAEDILEFTLYELKKTNKN